MSLHWILALTVTLLHCLTANSGPSPYHREIQRVIGDLQKVNCAEPSSTFYSPSDNNKCTIIQALKCSILELATVRTECFEKNSTSFMYINRTMELIKLKLELHNTLKDDPTDCCEAEPTKPYHEFLQNIMTLLQKLNSS